MFYKNFRYGLLLGLLAISQLALGMEKENPTVVTERSKESFKKLPMQGGLDCIGSFLPDNDLLNFSRSNQKIRAAILNSRANQLTFGLNRANPSDKESFFKCVKEINQQIPMGSEKLKANIRINLVFRKVSITDKDMEAIKNQGNISSISFIDVPEIPVKWLSSFLRLKKLMVHDRSKFDETKLQDHPSLEELDVWNLDKFTGRNLPSSLKRLTVNDCSQFDETKLQDHPSLEELAVWNLDKFTGRNLPSSLKELMVSNCSQFDETNLQDHPSLEELVVWNLDKFTGRNLPSRLKRLMVRACSEFDETNLQDHPSLEELEVSCSRIFTGKSLPHNLKKLKVFIKRVSLDKIDLQNCPSLEDLIISCPYLIEIKLPHSLKKFTIIQHDRFDEIKFEQAYSFKEKFFKNGTITYKNNKGSSQQS